MKALAGGWLTSVGERVSPLQALALAGVLALLALAAIPLRWVAGRVIDRDPDAAAPSRLSRAIAAAWTILVLSATPAARPPSRAPGA